LPLIELKPGGPSNLFLVHDGVGDTQVYLNLAGRLPGDLAVFGITPRNMPGIPLAGTRIEDIASFYVKEVRNKQPLGPYLLGGFCAGGVIAYEMASQLLYAGDIVDLVALLDAATPQAFKRREQRFGRLKQALAKAGESKFSAIGHACSAVALVLLKLVNALIRHGGRWWVRARFHLLHQLLARQRPWPRYIPELSLLQIYEFAAVRYVPKPLRGASVVLVRARHQTPMLRDAPFRAIYADETLGWGAITQDLAFIDAAGGHATMLLEPFVESLAAALLVRIDRKSEVVRDPRH
jgi:thioesterase domain-containing protein